MTLDEAIKHAEEVAEDKEIDAENQNPLFPNNIEECKKCAEEHRQLAEWLKDYKRLLEQEPCDDAISRANRLLDLANAIESDDSGYWTNKRISSALRNIPSVTPSRHKGKGEFYEGEFDEMESEE